MNSNDNGKKESPSADQLLKRIRRNINGKSADNHRDVPPEADESEAEHDRKTEAGSEKKITLEEFYGYDPIVRAPGSNIDHRGRTAKNRQSKKISADEEEKKTKSDNDTEYNLMSIFGMEKRTDDKQSEDVAEDVTEAEEDDDEALFSEDNRTDNCFEYDDESQDEGIRSGYKKKYVRAFLNIAGVALLMLFVGLIEYSSLLPLHLPAFLDIAYYPRVGLLLELQALVLAVAIMPKKFLHGLYVLLRGKSGADGVYALTTVAAALYIFVMIGVNRQEVNLAVFPAMLSALLAAVSDFLDLKREIYSFGIVSGKSDKLTVYRKSKKEAAAEISEMSRFLPDDNKYLAVTKAKRISNFYRNMNAGSSVTSGGKFLIMGGLLTALVFGIYLFVRRHSLLYAFVGSYTALMMALPFSAYFIYAYPLCHLSKRARANRSAVIGPRVLERFSAPATVTFGDADVFDENGVRLKSVKAYGKMPMDKVLRYAAAVLCPTGGSLGKVLESITESCDITDDMEFLNVSDDGIEAAVDGNHVLMGAYHFIVRNHLTIPYDEDMDEGDDVFMYMSVGGEVVAKLRLTYVPNADFEKVLQKLFSAGMTVAIKTFDPNIDLSLLCKTLGIDEKQPIKIIHTHNPLEVYEVKQSVDSILVSTGTLKQLTDTLHRCSKASHAVSICSVLSALSIVIAAVVMGVTLTMTDITEIPSVYIALYQIFWLIPTVLTSKFIS